MKIQGQFPEGAFLTLEQGERKTEVLSELIRAERGPPGLTMREGFPENPIPARKMGGKPLGHFNLKGSHVHPTVAWQDIPKTCSKNSTNDFQSATKVFTIPKSPFTIAISQSPTIVLPKVWYAYHGKSLVGV